MHTFVLTGQATQEQIDAFAEIMNYQPKTIEQKEVTVPATEEPLMLERTEIVVNEIDNPESKEEFFKNYFSEFLKKEFERIFTVIATKTLTEKAESQKEYIAQVVSETIDNNMTATVQ